MKRLSVVPFAVVAMLLLPPGIARAATVHGDFNGDGHADLAVGVPFEDVGSVTDAGAVEVLYGSAKGITSADDQFWHRSVAGVLGQARPGARFGLVLASGDFTGDGYADLAIAVGSSVHLLRGSPAGLTARNDQIIKLPSAVRSFAVGDLTGDGRADLAVGLPLADINDQTGAGAVQMLGGTRGGLLPLPGQLWSQNSPGVLNSSTADDAFGSSLAAGDFDRDGHADLAVGVPNESIHEAGMEIGFSGAVNVLRGAPGGLTATGNRFFSLSSPGLPGAVPSGDQYFGTALAAGDFDRDGFTDLAASAPEQNPFDISIAGHGRVIALYGSAAGLTGGRAQELLHPQGIIGDRFGWALTAADFNGDGAADLGIGAPGDEPPSQGLEVDWGSVVVMHGQAGTGITAAGQQVWGQYSPGVLETPASFEEFGTVVGAGDFRGDGAADLVIGVWQESLAPSGFEGAVNLLQGRPAAGLSAAGDQLWSQNSSGVLDSAEFGDGFGYSIAPG